MINLFSKEYINFGIFFFIITIIILLTSFSFYYILPNNYDLYDIKLINNNLKLDKNDKNKLLKLIKNRIPKENNGYVEITVDSQVNNILKRK